MTTGLLMARKLFNSSYALKKCLKIHLILCLKVNKIVCMVTNESKNLRIVLNGAEFLCFRLLLFGYTPRKIVFFCRYFININVYEPRFVKIEERREERCKLSWVFLLSLLCSDCLTFCQTIRKWLT